MHVASARCSAAPASVRRARTAAQLGVASLPETAGNITGEVSSEPEVLRGGHVFFQVTEDGERVDCAAFQPTGSFRQTILQLIPGDRVRVYGGVRASRRKEKWMLNLEKLEILDLAEITRSKLPNCKNCGGTLESMGRGQGLRCRKCGHKISTNSAPRTVVKLQRRLTRGVYLPPPRAHRHLAKPTVGPIDSRSDTSKDGGHVALIPQE